jgi:hypothetical protein
MKSTPLYPAMRAPHFVLRGAFVCLAGAVAGCVRFRRGFCVVIVAMRRNGQQLEARMRIRTQRLVRLKRVRVDEFSLCGA